MSAHFVQHFDPPKNQREVVMKILNFATKNLVDETGLTKMTRKASNYYIPMLNAPN